MGRALRAWLVYEYTYMYFASQSDCLGCAVLVALFVCLFVCLFDFACFFLPSFSSLIKKCILMRDEKEGKKQARSKQTNKQDKATQHVYRPCMYATFYPGVSPWRPFSGGSLP